MYYSSCKNCILLIFLLLLLISIFAIVCRLCCGGSRESLQVMLPGRGINEKGNLINIRKEVNIRTCSGTCLELDVFGIATSKAIT